MDKKHQTCAAMMAAIALLLLITDGKTAVSSVKIGIELCLQVVIPSLFPFLIVTTYLNAAIGNIKPPSFSFLARLLRIPKGAESIMLLGLLGGYPVGAQLITDGYNRRQIDCKTAHIMLGYCSNAGPAFIYGIVGGLFDSKLIPTVLWSIHILSALLTALFLPKPANSTTNIRNYTEITLSDALKSTIVACTTICGWILIFRLLIGYMMKWMKKYAYNMWTILLTGIMELSNGCLELNRITSEPHRFIVASAFLAFGGICVTLQTKTVTKALGMGLYIPGKILQTCFSIILAWFVSCILFPDTMSDWTLVGIGIFAAVIITLIKVIIKKVVEIR